ncbi:hypothetical protein CEXT_689911 [Caerostris extrusa]|uniref:Uncharacterized protein n=1 Tax=Caerostris extrusa TaxID=172846 RepID=A0AAV4T8F0_CAEEX|nr:hypothetical protein CEXT_689911 [Caerostris extrusa]
MRRQWFLRSLSTNKRSMPNNIETGHPVIKRKVVCEGGELIPRRKRPLSNGHIRRLIPTGNRERTPGNASLPSPAVRLGLKHEKWNVRRTVAIFFIYL